jgi:TIR domain/Pentapeptide repeats (8 copies)
VKNSATSVLFIDTATTKGMPNTKRNVPVTTDRMLEEPCEATSLTHGFEAERRGRPLRLGNQLGILKQGVKVWNAWRRKNLGVEIDLSNANLRDAILRGANLLLAAMRDANLSGAALVSVNLVDATLYGATLRGANLYDAILVNANLRGANLSGATLVNVNLRDATSGNTDLSEATLAYTTFVAVDLSTVKGLETVKHIGPSSIGIDTIYRSQGNISEAFLKGAGIPDSFIDYMRSLVGKPIDYYSCFISYSSKDDAFARRLHADLQSNNVRCWFAPEDMKIGDRIRSRIDESIRSYDKLLLVLSEHSVSSKWVEFEVEAAMDKEQEGKPPVLFPVRLDNTVLESTTAWAAHIKHTRHIGDFTSWKQHNEYQKAFTRLLRDLKAEAQKRES